jgi:hypothetical protein
MSGIQNEMVWSDDFVGGETFAAAGQGSPWAIAETSAAGTPVTAVVSPSATGEIKLGFDSTSEVQNVCLFNNDVLWLDIDNLQQVEYRVRVDNDSTALDSATSLAFGVCSARNATIDSLATHASFRLIGSNSLVVESDDGTTDKDDVATGQSLGETYKRFVIDFTGGKKDVKFYVDGTRVGASTVFDMSAATGSVQLYVQIQKTADTNVDAVLIDYVEVTSKRPV